MRQRLWLVWEVRETSLLLANHYLYGGTKECFALCEIREGENFIGAFNLALNG
jgi:hypothetical protein